MGSPRKSVEAPGFFGIDCQAVETGQPHRAADQIDQRDRPADVAEREQHRFGQQHRRSHAEGNDVRQRVEFLSERRFLPAEAGQPAIEQVEQTGAENQQDRVFIIAV